MSPARRRVDSVYQEDPMRKLTLTIAALIVFLSTPPVMAWHNAGHLTTATIAYLSLTTEARSRVDAILRQHPDFSRLSAGLNEEASDFGVVVFMRAAIWPDLIRRDPRFFDDTRGGVEPTPSLPGFPDMKVHKPWHFIDQPFSTDGTPTEPPAVPNALTQILEFQSALGDSTVAENVQAYDLSWLLHLVGDIHQPLHCASRFSAMHDEGDRGGNSFLLGSTENDMHTFWDGVIGEEDDPQRIVALATSFMKEFKRDETDAAIGEPAAVASTVLHWVDESATLARYVVYTIGVETNRAPHPKPSSAYRNLARTIARHRIAVGGYRLASMIEARLE
jgi:S1/P1 Nuclease